RGGRGGLGGERRRRHRRDQKGRNGAGRQQQGSHYTVPILTSAWRRPKPGPASMPLAAADRRTRRNRLSDRKGRAERLQPLDRSCQGFGQIGALRRLQPIATAAFQLFAEAAG